MSVAIGWADIRYCATNNNRRVAVAASATEAFSGDFVYFITNIEGSNTVVKDKDGNTILTVSGNQRWEPGEFRFDGGFQITNSGGSPNEVYFFMVPVKGV